MGLGEGSSGSWVSGQGAGLTSRVCSSDGLLRPQEGVSADCPRAG